MEPKARSRASSTRYGDIRVLLTTTDLACSIPDFAIARPEGRSRPSSTGYGRA